MAKRRDLTKLSGDNPLSSDSILSEQKLTPRTIRFSEEDEQEIDRIDAYLREKGLLRTDAAKIIRLALRVAFRDINDEELVQLHQDIKVKYARGKKSALAT